MATVGSKTNRQHRGREALLCMNNQKNIYFPVEDVHYDELYDWSKKSEKCRTTIGTVNRLQRQSSATGSLVEANEKKVALFRYGENVYAVQEKCPHAGGPLHVGDIEVLPDMSVCVRCPWHSWRVDLKTGKVKIPKGRDDRKAEVYPVQVESDGKLRVGFDSFDMSYFSRDDF